MRASWLEWKRSTTVGRPRTEGGIKRRNDPMRHRAGGAIGLLFILTIGTVSLAAGELSHWIRNVAPRIRAAS
jgi:hypothetical protein